MKLRWWCSPREQYKWKALAPEEWDAGDTAFTLRQTRDGPVHACVQSTDVGWWWTVTMSEPGSAIRWSTAGRHPTLAGAMRACEIILEDKEKADAEVAS